MTRTELQNMLYRRHLTVRFATEKVSFLVALNNPAQFSHGQPTEVDGDAIAILRAAVSA